MKEAKKIKKIGKRCGSHSTMLAQLLQCRFGQISAKFTIWELRELTTLQGG